MTTTTFFYDMCPISLKSTSWQNFSIVLCANQKLSFWHIEIFKFKMLHLQMQQIQSQNKKMFEWIPMNLYYSTSISCFWCLDQRHMLMPEHSFQVPMPNSPLLLTIYALAHIVCKSQGKLQKYLFLHFDKGVCCCHGNRAG